MLIGGNQINNFMSISGSGTVINYGSGYGSNFLTSYGSGYGSGSTSQKATVPTVPVPVPQHCITQCVRVLHMRYILPNITSSSVQLSFSVQKTLMSENYQIIENKFNKGFAGDKMRS